jgi:hypothetical protein
MRRNSCIANVSIKAQMLSHYEYCSRLDGANLQLKMNVLWLWIVGGVFPKSESKSPGLASGQAMTTFS